ncbi:hypothetical protein AURANDRAFT_54478 [Aureococcus anophagefferens]|uniref:PPM-type phosphatase domain-containing protein n=1 Tax=Aureococcus anophagefferens TaxID=44056 RepID=F0YGM1_AURAN|nr:hypothetical protein AURANDRAFT_54478 [Aureococcus anophagefferens]EGB05772.1 hypothetical protein AURANDRAFT_54478 [Aureococcus anophagefferens]|eukprot:XP_009039611.1 hypothetical protein AURANDRAFT_54478 [Aureococcus anophagefferens]
MEHVADQILEREPRISIPDLLVQTNETVDRNLHKNFHIPSDDSGSTAVSVLAIGSTLYCSNVGDSRCILGVRNPAGKVVPKALSSDQTLYRADERQRVLDLGGRIDQNGDPPRIWLQKKFEPGCAFSRSLGDKIAETVGCVATPEIMAHELSDDDVVCIIASDGVWEFLTNQNVVDICLATLDPYTASYKIVSTAYQEWYEQEERIDDISVIVLFFGRHEMQQNNDQNVRLDTLPKRSRRGSHAKLAVEFEKTASILPVEERNTRRGSFSRLGFSKTRGSMDA